MLHQTTVYYEILRWCKNLTVKLSQKKLQNKTINLPSYIFNAHTLILQATFFIHLIKCLPLVLIVKVSILAMPCILEIGIREQQKYEKRKQISVDNTVNNLHHESLKIV